MRLNNGQKWQTDETLRRGMSEMQHILGTSLGRIHAGQFTSADYGALAGRLQAQVHDVVANCKLPEGADVKEVAGHSAQWTTANMVGGYSPCAPQGRDRDENTQGSFKRMSSSPFSTISPRFTKTLPTSPPTFAITFTPRDILGVCHTSSRKRGLLGITGKRPSFPST